MNDLGLKARLSSQQSPVSFSPSLAGSYPDQRLGHKGPRPESASDLQGGRAYYPVLAVMWGNGRQGQPRGKPGDGGLPLRGRGTLGAFVHKHISSLDLPASGRLVSVGYTQGWF